MTVQLVSNDQWKQALRSGKYTQGRSLVSKHSKALCAIAVLAVESGYLSLDPDYNITEYKQKEFVDAFVARYGSALVSTVVLANDLDGKTFDQIADMLEAA